MDPSTKARIETLVASSPIFVFMKGSKLMPQCGFSNNVVQILHSLGVAFETFDVLSDPEVRQGIKEFSSWPTIPQVYVKGEFIGGSDILIEMYNSPGNYAKSWKLLSPVNSIALGMAHIQGAHIPVRANETGGIQDPAIDQLLETMLRAGVKRA